MAKNQTVAAAIAAAYRAHENCLDAGNLEWAFKWEARLDNLIKECLPSGSGFDGDITLVEVADNKLVFAVPYHPMNSNGYYEAWEAARVVVRPVWGGLDVTARGAGSMHNDYIAEEMHAHLSEVAPEPTW